VNQYRNETRPKLSVYSLVLLLLLLLVVVVVVVFSPWASLSRNQSRQATGMALVCCILDKFLGAGAFPRVYTFPLLPPGASTSATTREILAAKDGTYGRESLSGNFVYMASLFTPLWIFYMPQIYDMGPTALLPLRRRAC